MKLPAHTTNDELMSGKGMQTTIVQTSTTSRSTTQGPSTPAERGRGVTSGELEDAYRHIDARLDHIHARVDEMADAEQIHRAERQTAYLINEIRAEVHELRRQTEAVAASATTARSW